MRIYTIIDSGRDAEGDDVIVVRIDPKGTLLRLDLPPSIDIGMNHSSTVLYNMHTDEAALVIGLESMVNGIYLERYPTATNMFFTFPWRTKGSLDPSPSTYPDRYLSLSFSLIKDLLNEN